MNGESGENLVEQYGMIPARVVHPDQPVELVERHVNPGQAEIIEIRRPALPSAVPSWLTLLTCVFLHGGWAHILGNLWFLYIFGDNIEDRMGHVGFALFYVVCGVAASAVHLAVNPGSSIPTIGASGAIAGVMGAYFVLYPRARVLSVVPIFFFLQMFVLPAPLFLGVWFAMQFFQGAFTATATGAGVAWWAHVGGFAAGVAIAFVLKVTSAGHASNEPPPPGTYGRNYRVYVGPSGAPHRDWR